MFAPFVINWSKQHYPLLTEEREYCGAMLATTVAALWEARTEMARLQDAVRDYRMAVDNSVDNPA